MPTPAAPRRPPRGTLLRAFAFAGAGLADATLRERNLRIHLVLGTLAACGASALALSPAERAVLLLCIGAVVAAETFNSAIEVIVDGVFPDVDERARFAKDAAAGAVLALAVASVLVGAAVLAPAIVEGIRLGDGGRLAQAAAVSAALAFAISQLPRATSLRWVNLALGLAALVGLPRLLVSPWGLVAAALLYVLAARAGARAPAGRGPPGHVRGPASPPGAP